MDSDDDETDFIGFSPVKRDDTFIQQFNISDIEQVHEVTKQLHDNLGEPLSFSEDIEQAHEITKQLHDNLGEQLSASDIEQANAMAKQLHVFKPGINFVPGAKLEVLDARDNKWYQCRVVQVDWGELDILVHYERWSVRFDEWLKMDSTRIRSLTRSTKEKIIEQFKVGEKVLGYWAPDSKYYLCIIKKHTSEEFFEVQFYDGYTKSLRYSQLKKITNPRQYSGIDIKKSPKSLKQLPLTPGSVVTPIPTPPAVLEVPELIPQRRKSESAVLFSPSATQAPLAQKVEREDAGLLVPEFSNEKRNIFDVEILDEKRKTKRKPELEELLRPKKKRRLDDESEAQIILQEKLKTSTPVYAKPKFKKEILRKECAEKVKIPDLASFPTSEGMPSRDINHFEVDVGYGWKQVCTRRPHGTYQGKWDVYFVAADERKLRTRHELVRYCNEHASQIKPEELDFSVRNAKFKYDKANQIKGDISNIKEETQSDEEDQSSWHEQETVDVLQHTPLDEEYDKDEDYDRDDSLEPSEGESDDDSMDDDKKTPSKDTVRKDSSSSSESELESSPEKLCVASVKLSQILRESVSKDLLEEKTPHDLSESLINKDPLTPKQMEVPRQRHFKKEQKTPVVITTSPNSESSHKCPSKTCEKSFRKENLLQMHMKHYHPELLKKRSLQAPNVADLAYARTVGDHLDVASQSPSSLSFPSVDFMMPEKKMEVPRKSRPSEGKKSAEKKIQGRVSKDIKRDDSKPSFSDSEEGNNLDVARVEEENAFARKAARAKNEPEIVPKTSKKKPKEKTIANIGTTRRRTRKSESVYEDDPGEKKAAKSQSSRRRTLPGLRSTVPTLSETKPNTVEHQEEENVDNWNEQAQSDDHEDAIINCGCKSQDEDGLMLQCDVCLTWQHGGCYNIESEEQVPEKYICSLCENPRGQRSSMRFRHHQEWLKEGKLPRFSFSTGKPNIKLESCIRRGHELSANVLQLSQLIYSMRLKLNMSKEADHPKFVMWHKEWKEKERFEVEAERASKGSEDKLSQPLPESEVPPVQDFMQTFSQPATQVETQEAYIVSNFKNHLPSYDPPSLSSHSSLKSDIVTSGALDSKDPGADNASKSVLSDSVVESEQNPKTETSQDRELSSEIVNNFPLVKPVETFIGKEESDSKKQEDTAKLITKEITDQTDKQDSKLIEQCETEPEVKNQTNEDSELVEHCETESEVKNLTNEDSELVEQCETEPNVKTQTNEEAKLVEKCETEPEVKTQTNKEDSKLHKQCEIGLEVKNHTSKDYKLIEQYESEPEINTGDDLKMNVPDRDVLMDEVENAVAMEVIENKMKDISIKKSDIFETKSDSKPDEVNQETTDHKPLQVSTPTEESLPDKPFSLKLDIEPIFAQKEQTEEQVTKDELEKKIDKPDYPSIKGAESTQDSLEDTEDFDLALRALGASADASINVRLVDLLSSHPDLEQLVDVAGSELPSLVQHTLPIAPAPIIPKNERIEPVKCKLNLLKHVEQIQDKVFERFDLIEDEIKALETEMGLPSEISPEEEQLLNSNEGEDRDAITQQARALVQMILRDIDTVKKLSEFSES